MVTTVEELAMALNPSLSPLKPLYGLLSYAF
jgi:hypothetical protein